MFEEVHRSGLAVIRARDIPAGVQHGFSTRRGGESVGVFHGLNLGISSGDGRRSIVTNWHRFLDVLGLQGYPVAHVRQVHGGRIVRASPGALSGSFTSCGEADGLWTDASGVVLTVFTADCVPIIIHGDGERPFVMILHGGWRGIADGIIEQALEQVGKEISFEPDQLTVVTGPSIGACCFEVEQQVADRVMGVLNDPSGVVRESPRGKSWLNIDLAQVAKRVFLEMGVPAQRILICDHCTCCHGDDFYSHRRSLGAERGRMASVVALYDETFENVKPESSVSWP